MMLFIAIMYAIFGVVFIAGNHNITLAPFIQGLLMLNLSLMFIEVFFLRKRVALLSNINHKLYGGK